MTTFLKLVVALSLLATIGVGSGLVKAPVGEAALKNNPANIPAQQPQAGQAPESQAAEKVAPAITPVIVLEGPQEVGAESAVKQGTIVRVTGSTPSGGTVSVAVKGSGQLLRQSSLRTFKGGRPMIGALIMEYDIQTTTPGPLEITVIKQTFDLTLKPVEERYMVMVK
ncbi:MAG: hypothetical protein C0478_02965 [Planctomyces sp.]|nr:hypothetical protein [Planctomyces sp.]